MARPRKFDTEAALDAAMNLFWQRGYEGTGLAELLDVMGLQRGSLYKAWGSKKGLFLAVLNRYDALYIGPGIAFLSGEGAGQGMSGSDRIARVFTSHDPRGCLMCNSAGGIAGLDKDVAVWIETRIERLIAAFETALADGVSNAPVSLREEAVDLTNRYIGRRIGQRVAGSQELVGESV